MDFIARYLRLAEMSVGQSAPQPRDASRSTFSHNAKLTKIMTVTTSLARVLSLIIPHPRTDGADLRLIHFTRRPVNRLGQLAHARPRSLSSPPL
jgi:hypothetical protein